MTDPKVGMVLLPTYLVRQQDGIFIDLSLFSADDGFRGFLDRMFGDGVRFTGLDYRLLMGLLYFYDDILATHGKTAKLRLARDIVAFSPRRKSLYKAVKVDVMNQQAEYFFEPVALEFVTEEIVYGEIDAEGVSPILTSTRKMELRPTSLDVDEFIADMWLKGVRFCIDIAAVADVISRNQTVRMVIAVQLEATEGSDAEIEEACNVLHRDNAPIILVNGYADLRRFRNRFPQISMGARLLKKKPRVLGKPGYRVNGAMIEPLLPKDINLLAMAGPGTRVEMQDGKEYILSSRDGFLSLGVKSNIISVTEKIEDKGGVSIKTTGDLSLFGNEFIEHGEVQEGRAIEGKNMTFRSDVYGDIVSQGGFILLERNLSKGSAKSYGGDVTSNGQVFNSTIEARGGKVSLKYAESSLIMGDSVTIEHAVNCEIVANNIQIASAKGCGIIGRNIQVKSSASSRGKETAIIMMVPDLSGLDSQLRQVRMALADCNKTIEAKERGLALVKPDADVEKYLKLVSNIQKGNVKLNAMQQENWQKITARFAKVHSVAGKLIAEIQEQLNRTQAFLQEQTHLMEAREKICAGIRCEIVRVTGDTMVRSMVVQNGLSEFRNSRASEIRTRLHDQGLKREQIFSNSAGSLDWSYEAPVESPEP